MHPVDGKRTLARWALLWSTCGLLAGRLALAQPAQLQIAWDKDLAFENDRKGYEELLTQVVGQAYGRVSGSFGKELTRLTIQVHSPAGYQSSFGPQAAAARGAHYFRGEIHVNGGARLDERFTGMLVHELVHAFLDFQGTSGRIPIWLNEGMAELHQWRALAMADLAPNQLAELKRALEEKKLTPFPAHGPLSPFQYLQSYAVVLYLDQQHGGAKLGEVLGRLLQGQSPEVVFRKVLGSDQIGLEQSFAEWIKRR